MNIEDMTIGQAKFLAKMFSGENPSSGIDDFANGEHVIVRTYSAGVWAGTLKQKCKNEIIMEDARRLWKWHAAQGISLSSVALYGIDPSKSRIEPPVHAQWLEAIEITPTAPAAEKSIKDAPHAKAQ